MADVKVFLADKYGWRIPEVGEEYSTELTKGVVVWKQRQDDPRKDMGWLIGVKLLEDFRPTGSLD
jgi:hypothetical protein